MNNIERAKNLDGIIRKHRQTIQVINKIIEGTLKASKEICDKMTQEEYEEFAQWYVQQNTKEYNITRRK